MTKFKSMEDQDPCSKERKQLYQCMSDNNYDKSKCEAHLSNGKMCKEFWFRVMSQRRINNIQPNMPGPEEREKIRREYFETHQKPIHKRPA